MLLLFKLQILRFLSRFSHDILTFWATKKIHNLNHKPYRQHIPVNKIWSKLQSLYDGDDALMTLETRALVKMKRKLITELSVCVLLLAIACLKVAYW